MTWGLKIALAGIAFKDWILPNFNLDLQQLITSLCYVLTCIVDNFNTIMHACLDLFVPSSSLFFVPWLLLRVLNWALPT